MSANLDNADNATGEGDKQLSSLQQVLGLGSGSFRKNYYSELQSTVSELKHYKNFLNNIINSMPSAIIGIDSNGMITHWNATAATRYSLSYAEALGKEAIKVLPPEYAIAEHLEAMIDKKVIEISRVKRLMWDFPLFENITIYPLVTNGMDGAAIRIDDISREIQLEEAMIQSEKMVSVGGLAAGMAHEINNPIGGMVQNAFNLENRLINLHLEANVLAAQEVGLDLKVLIAYLEKRNIGKMVGQIVSSGLRASTIVANMLNFAQSTEGVYSTHDVDALIDSSIELAKSDYSLKNNYDFKSIVIVKGYETEVPPIPCDRVKIQQVILNILLNGADSMFNYMRSLADDAKTGYTPKFIISVSQLSDGESVSIRIKDNGPGVDDSIRKRVFEPFFTTKPVGSGTDLGLSVSYFIIKENHGGSFNIESTPGDGACFVINLPIYQRVLNV